MTLEECLNQLDKEIQEFEQRFGIWIKSSDRLPTDDCCYWVVVKKTKAVLVCCFNPDHQCWDDEDGDDFAFDVNEISHWQPYLVPAPPKE